MQQGASDPECTVIQCSNKAAKVLVNYIRIVRTRFKFTINFN
jgi:hypothetical protein